MCTVESDGSEVRSLCSQVEARYVHCVVMRE